MKEAALILLVAVLTPFVVYLSAKLGAYGWCRGSDIYQNRNQRKGTTGGRADDQPSR